MHAIHHGRARLRYRERLQALVLVDPVDLPALGVDVVPESLDQLLGTLLLALKAVQLDPQLLDDLILLSYQLGLAVDLRLEQHLFLLRVAELVLSHFQPSLQFSLHLVALSLQL